MLPVLLLVLLVMLVVVGAGAAATAGAGAGAAGAADAAAAVSAGQHAWQHGPRLAPIDIRMANVYTAVSMRRRVCWIHLSAEAWVAGMSAETSRQHHAE